MKKLTTTSYAILSLLAIQPWSAYELAKEMQRNVGAFWPRAERGVYDEPRNLVAHGLARADLETEGERRRTRYTITTDGRSALGSWLATPLAESMQVESEALVRVAFAENGTLPDLHATLQSLHERFEVEREFLADLATQYAQGAGRYPQRIHLISLIAQFFDDYYLTAQTWAKWAAEQADSWGSLDLAASDEQPRQTLRDIAERYYASARSAEGDAIPEPPP